MSENNIHVDIDIEKIANDLTAVAKLMVQEDYNSACILIGIMVGEISQKLKETIKEKKDEK